MGRPRTVSAPLPKPAWANRGSDANTRRKIRERDEREKAREAAKPTPPPVAPLDLRPYQLEAIEFHLKARYSLNCSEMGLGKSIMALETAKKTGLQIAVFGPVFLERTWANEAAKVGVKITYFPYTQLFKVKEETLKPFRFWIADEFHYCKNPSAQRTEIFYSRMKEFVPDYFIGMTGTPIKNRVPDFWTLLACCNLCPTDTIGKRMDGPYGAYYRFASHFCYVEESFIRGNHVRKFVGVREDRLPELKSLLAGKYIKFTADKVLKDLPEMTRKHVDLGLRPDAKLKEVFDAYMSGRKVDSAAKAQSALLKAPSTSDYCNAIIEEFGGPLLIYTDHIESAKYIQANIANSVLCTGERTAHVRGLMVDEFQAGKYDAIVATIGSLSVGVTLTRARHVVFNDCAWSASDNQQAEKRIHRIGQKSACFAHYIHSSPTDQLIFDTLWEKIETINEVMND